MKILLLILQLFILEILSADILTKTTLSNETTEDSALPYKYRVYNVYTMPDFPRYKNKPNTKVMQYAVLKPKGNEIPKTSHHNPLTLVTTESGRIKENNIKKMSDNIDKLNSFMARNNKAMIKDAMKIDRKQKKVYSAISDISPEERKMKVYFKLKQECNKVNEKKCPSPKALEANKKVIPKHQRFTIKYPDYPLIKNYHLKLKPVFRHNGLFLKKTKGNIIKGNPSSLTKFFKNLHLKQIELTRIGDSPLFSENELTKTEEIQNPFLAKLCGK